MIDPTQFEEAIMKSRMTATLNTNGDICAIQKGGGVGVIPSVVMQCLRIASVKAADITTKIKDAVRFCLCSFIVLFFCVIFTFLEVEAFGVAATPGEGSYLFKLEMP